MREGGRIGNEGEGEEEGEWVSRRGGRERLGGARLLQNCAKLIGSSVTVTYDYLNNMKVLVTTQDIPLFVLLWGNDFSFSGGTRLGKYLCLGQCSNEGPIYP